MCAFLLPTKMRREDWEAADNDDDVDQIDSGAQARASDDVIRALDLLYRRGGIGPTHARVLRRWGERFTVPAPGGTSAEDALLWSEAMAQLDGVLRPKGIFL
jgi:hypothetical protein